MPFLSFEAVDSNGKTVRGTLQANSIHDLELMLMQRGMRLVNSGAPTVQAQTPRPAPVARPVAPPNVQRQVQRPVEAPRVVPTPPSSATHPQTASPSFNPNTPELSQKEFYFLFTQFASFFRSGFSASQAIHHTTSNSPPKLRAMFAEMERETEGGMALSESMARRPKTFYPDIIAVVKAGEHSGHMPEAFDVLVDQMGRGKAFKWALIYAYAMTAIILFCGIVGIGLQRASASTIDRQFEADGQLPVAQTLMHEIGTRGPREILLAVVITVGFLLAIKLYNKRNFRRSRHLLGLYMPIGGSRARSEAIERFSWTMSTMLRAGASPASSVHTAAASIPNLILSERALAGLGQTRENEPLASVMGRTGLIGPEYVHIAMNGEMVGDAPGAIDTIKNAEAAQIPGKTAGLNVTIAIITTVLMGILAGALVGSMYYMYASHLVKMINSQ